MDRTRIRKAAIAGLALNMALPLAISLQGQQNPVSLYDITTRGPTILSDQINHPWAAFSVGNSRFIALEERIETLSDAGVDVYRVDPNRTVKLSDSEKKELFSDKKLKDAVLQALEKMKHVHPHSLRR